MSASYFPLPLVVEEVTPEWLTAALRQRAPDVTVRGFEIFDKSFTTCSKLWLKLDLSEAGKRAGIPERVVLKAGFEDHGRTMWYMHEREVRAYRDILPRVHLPAPACYFADYDAARKQGIVIMEDLRTRNVTFCNAFNPGTYEQIASRLTALAQFHGKAWDSPDLKPGGRWADVPVFFESLEPFFDMMMSVENWERLTSLPRSAAMSMRFMNRAWMIDAYKKMVRFSRQLPQCLLHSDPHPGNVYHYPDGAAGFYDPVASVGPGMFDVTYHIVTSADVADRRQWEGPLIQHYLDELAREGVTPPSLEEATHQFAIFLVYGCFAWTTNESYYQTESVITASASRVGAAMLDHDVMGLLKKLNFD
jgi:hypothetical protein